MLKHFFVSLIIVTCLIGCQKSESKTMNKQEQIFLAEISKNAYASISSYTEVKRLPTDEFFIVTHYPLTQEQIIEYQKNGFLKNTQDELHDAVIYSIKNYELKNEKGEHLTLITDHFSPYLKALGLWEYDHILSKNLGLEFKLDQKFEILTGFIDLEYQLNHQSLVVHTPIEISIHDKGLE